VKGGLFLKVNRKAVLSLLAIVIVLVICIGITIILGVSKSKEKADDSSTESTTSGEEKEEQTKQETQVQHSESETTQEKQYTYNNLDGLYFIPSKEHENLKIAVEQYLSENHYDMTKITVMDAIKTEDEIFYTFWLLLDSQVVIRGNYHYDLNEYAFIEEMDKKVISRFIDTSMPDDVDAASDEYAYMPLTIENLEELESFIPKESYEQLPDELTDFLDSQNELRRLFKVTDIKEESASIQWVFTFDIPRIDGKNVSVTYSEDTFNFKLE